MRIAVAAALIAAVAVPPVAEAAGHVRPAGAAVFQVGTSVADITPPADHPQYLGGFGQMAAPTSQVHDPLQVRAFAVSNGTKLVEFAIVDSQGWFAGYQEGPYGVTDARAEAARWLGAHGFPGTEQGDLIVSSTHSHAAPTLMGIWGPVDVDYLRLVHDRTVQALEEAASSTRPAELWTASADSSAIDGTNVSQTDIYDGYAVDPDTPVLWARDPQTLKTVGLYANVPVHADVACGSCDDAMSADHIGVAREQLGERLGGTAVVAMGTLGRQESIVQVGRWSYSNDVGMTVADEVLTALDHARPLTSTVLAAAEQYVVVPVTNPALGALVYANLLAPYTCTPAACTIDRSITPPYAVGGAVGTWVTGFRLGDVAYISEPGEAFPEVSRAIRDGITGASAVHVVGMAQDQVGYYFPPEEAPATTATNDSDHLTYNTSLTLADVTVQAADSVASALGFAASYVHPTPMQEDGAARDKPGVQFFAVAPGLVPDGSLTVDSAVNPARDGAALDTHDGQGAIAFDWGDGTTSYGGSTSGDGRGRARHSYAAPGTYTITGTVTDTTGRTRTYRQVVVLRSPD